MSMLGGRSQCNDKRREIPNVFWVAFALPADAVDALELGLGNLA